MKLVIFFRNYLVAFKLQKIDDSLIKEHIHLSKSDNCYFFGDYVGKQGYHYSAMNQLIHNFKKPIEKQKNPLEWKYKQDAVVEISNMLCGVDIWQAVINYMWVPVPPSKLKTNQEYDDRLILVLKKLQKKEVHFDFRELLSIKTEKEPAHLSSVKRCPDDHLNNLIFDETKQEPTPKGIVIFDDVITTGATFKAAKSVLAGNYPRIPIIGIFVARSIRKIGFE